MSNGSLKVNRAEIRDAGIYICVAQNSAGTALGQVRLQVQGKLNVNAHSPDLAH